MFLRISIILVLGFAGIANRIEARVSAIGSDNGLPDKYITAICKDKHGLMWISTRQGLCTYDGYGFEALKAKALHGATITKLLYDEEQDLIWLGTNKGLFSLNSGNRKVTFISNGSKEAPQDVTGIYATSQGRLYIAYRSGEIGTFNVEQGFRGITKLSLANKQVPFYANAMQLVGSEILLLHVSPHQRPFQLNLKEGSVERIASGLYSKPFYSMTSKGDTLITESSGESLTLSDKKNGQDVTPAFLRNFQHEVGIVDVQFTSDNTMLVVSKPCRLFKIDLKKGRIDTISSDVFTGRLATSLWLDEQHNMWLGTNKGLISITDEQQFFEQSLVKIPPISIRTLAKDENGNIYAGTYGGLFKYVQSGKNWQRLSGNIPYAMLNVRGDYLYFVGEERLLHGIHKKTGQIEDGFYSRQQLPEDELRQAFTLDIDERGIIWIGTSYGLATYDPGTNTLSTAESKNLLPINIEVRYLRTSAGGRIWVCSRDGLYEIDQKKGVLWHISSSTQPALSANTVNYLDIDREGKLWLCTDGGGINIISKDRKHVTVLKKEDGLSDNTTYNLLWQGTDRIWISTFNGLSSYNTVTNKFYNYYVSDGLSSNEFNHNACLRDTDGRIYFGSINGLNSFYPENIPSQQQHTRLFASSISKWDNNAKADTNIYLSDTSTPIVLNPLDHSLTFNLALTDYSNPENNVFRYRILGLFDEWVSLNNPHTLRLDGLAAGNYVLEIKALDNRGVPALNILRYRIEVGQPFYKVWWFYLALFLLASGITWYFFYLRIQNLRKVQHIRQQISSDLHDEVGSLLTRITMTSDNLSFSSNSEAEKESKLKKIASLSRTAVSSMSDILWAIDGRNDYTGNLGDRMREHAEEMLLPLHIDLHFEMQANQRMSISSELRQQLYLIYKEAINNIVKHSKATDVQISYVHNERGMRLSIVNNGYAAKEKASSKGQGLNNIAMRARRIKALATTGSEGGQFKVEIVAK